MCCRCRRGHYTGEQRRSGCFKKISRFGEISTLVSNLAADGSMYALCTPRPLMCLCALSYRLVDRVSSISKQGGLNRAS